MQAGEPSDNAGGGAPGRSGNCASELWLVELQLSEFVPSHRLSWVDLSLHTRIRAAVQLQHRSEVRKAVIYMYTVDSARSGCKFVVSEGGEAI